VIRASAAVFEHKVVSYRRSWRRSLLSAFVLPVLFLVGLGGWVGRYVDAQGLLDARYIDYIGPGLLAATALQVAATESTWPVFASLSLTRTYHAMRASALEISDILVGTIAYVLFRVLVAATAFLLVLVAAGSVHSTVAIAALPVCLLVGWAMAASACAYAASIRHVAGVAVWLRSVVVPMTLFSGIFFPVAALPSVPRVLAYASPLWHGVELCRAATLGTATAWGAGWHTAYLVSWCGAATWLARVRFGARLRG
jgi:lipooligosaccharide transport system permease protein